MYVFGGWNGKEYFSDVCTFDLEKMVWNKLETSGTPPIPRQGHASCVVGHNLIIQGGFSFDEKQYKSKFDNYGTFLKVSKYFYKKFFQKFSNFSKIFSKKYFIFTIFSHAT